MDLQLLTAKIVQSLRQDGLQATFRKAFAHLNHGGPADDFDLKYGTDTCRPEPLWKFKISAPNARFGARYQATNAQELADVVNFLHEDP